MRSSTTMAIVLAAAAPVACFMPGGSIINLTDALTHADAGAGDAEPDDTSTGPDATTSSPTGPEPTGPEPTSHAHTDDSGSSGCTEVDCLATTADDASSGSSTGCDGACTTGLDDTSGASSSGPGDRPVCGDGDIDPPETCDDGNVVGGDGCSADCTEERRVFVTAATFNGDLAGIGAADAECQSSADDVQLEGSFKAWLSDGPSSPWGRFDITYTGAYLRMDGAVVAKGGWPDLTDGQLAVPIALDELGAEVIVTPYVWTGTDVDGGTLTNHCDGWKSAAPASYGLVGSVFAKDAAWTNADLLACSTKLRLYCIEDPAP